MYDFFYFVLFSWKLDSCRQLKTDQNKTIFAESISFFDQSECRIVVSKYGVQILKII